MSEPGAKAEKPYRYCDAHFVMNCPVCNETAVPSPVSGDPMPVVEMPTDGVEAPLQTKSRVSRPLPPPEPAFTDPVAVAVARASKRFSEAQETLAVIEAQMAEVAKAADTLKQKHGEAVVERQTAQAALMEAINGKQ